MSALRLNAPGKPVRLIPLGPDTPVEAKTFADWIRVMRVPLTDRLAPKPTSGTPAFLR